MIQQFADFLAEAIISKNNFHLTTYDSWEEIQSEVNTSIGWQELTIYKSYRGKNINGKKTLNIQDPFKDDTIFLSYKNDDGVITGIANIYVDHDNSSVWIGNFEVRNSLKGQGYGRAFFTAIEQEYPNYEFGLTFLDKNARHFWESMGFTIDHAKVMYKNNKGDR